MSVAHRTAFLEGRLVRQADAAGRIRSPERCELDDRGASRARAGARHVDRLRLHAECRGAAFQATSVDSAPDAGSRRLAYEHHVSAEVAGGRQAEAFETIHRRCRSLGTDACEELSSHISSGRAPGASFQFRTAPSAIPLLLETVWRRGEVVEQSTK